VREAGTADERERVVQRKISTTTTTKKMYDKKHARAQKERERERQTDTHTHTERERNRAHSFVLDTHKHAERGKRKALQNLLSRYSQNEKRRAQQKETIQNSKLSTPFPPSLFLCTPPPSSSHTLPRTTRARRTALTLLHIYLDLFAERARERDKRSARSLNT